MSSRTPVFVAALVGLAVLAGGLAHPASAGTIRDDRADSLYLDLAQQPAYAPVGEMTVSTSGGGVLGSGTLVANDWVLTAAHVVDEATSATFSVGGATYQATEWYVHPAWTGSSSNSGDLALVHLANVVEGIVPAKLYAGTGEVDTVGTIVGYGQSGTGLTGAITPAGTKRAGQNLIGGLGSVIGYPDTTLLVDFDYPNPTATGKAICLDLEYLPAPGDSGGGWFLEENGQTYLAGVTSFLYALDFVADADYGDIAGAVRVSDYIDWIQPYLPGKLPGDIDGDALVNLQDLAILAGTYGQCGTDLPADLTNDGCVNLGDLAMLAGHYQFPATAAAPTGDIPPDATGTVAITPEPATGTLVLISSGLALLRRRR